MRMPLAVASLSLARFARLGPLCEGQRVQNSRNQPHSGPMSTKSAVPGDHDDLRPEYDLSKLTGGVRGKYYERATAGTTLVLLERDVAEAFPDGQTVNQALRALIKVAKTQTRTKSSRGTLANPLQPTSRARKVRSKSKKRPRAARGRARALARTKK
jgi:hypothetical protein